MIDSAAPVQNPSLQLPGDGPAAPIRRIASRERIDVAPQEPALVNPPRVASSNNGAPIAAQGAGGSGSGRPGRPSWPGGAPRVTCQVLIGNGLITTACGGALRGINDPFYRELANLMIGIGVSQTVLAGLYLASSRPRSAEPERSRSMSAIGKAMAADGLVVAAGSAVLAGRGVIIQQNAARDLGIATGALGFVKASTGAILVARTHGRPAQPAEPATPGRVGNAAGQVMLVNGLAAFIHGWLLFDKNDPVYRGVGIAMILLGAAEMTSSFALAASYRRRAEVPPAPVELRPL